MLRNTFLAVLAVLAGAAVSQAAITEGAAGDAKTSVSYNATTGAFGIQPDGTPVGLFQILSASNVFTNSASAVIPAGGLGFDVKAAGELAWAALPANAINANHNLGVVAAPGLTKTFLLGDLTFNYSGGFGTNNLIGDLVCIECGAPPVLPVISIVAVGEYESAAKIMRNLTASNGPNTWSNLIRTPGSAGNPAIGATLMADGTFMWDPAGSRRGPKGAGIQYSWTATATNGAGGATGVAITLSLIPEPATVSLLGLAMVGLVGLIRRR